MKDLAIVLATYNRLALLKDCVESIRRSVGNLTYEIVITDGGSDDGTQAWLAEQADVHAILQALPLTGAVKAFNLGFAYAVDQGSPFVAYLNDDAVMAGPDPEMQRAVELMRADASTGGVAFEYSYRDAWVFGIWFGKVYVNLGVIRREAGMRAAVEQGDPTGRAWWNPEYHTYAADTELGLRIWEMGLRIHKGVGWRVRHRDDESQDAMRANNAAVYHRGSEDAKRFVTRWSRPIRHGQVYVTDGPTQFCNGTLMPESGKRNVFPPGTDE
jgi:GT2 family glycosyltransferase